MLLSGFTMAKNAAKLYYPIKQSIMSILPIVDEFIVALGDCDADDTTQKEIESINNPKIKIIHTVWDLKKYPRGMENAHQTDIAKSHCQGTWLFYLQADEVIHEQHLELIKNLCEKYKNTKKVEGFLFKYLHFWGDYEHYHNSHGWYKNEIRIIRNDPDIHSWESAQSFRRIPNFDGINYRQKKNTFKLNVLPIDAYVFHYGWVRPPELMKSKTKALSTIHKGKDKVAEMERMNKFEFDYGPLQKLKIFKKTHPSVMEQWIANFNWKHELQYSGGRNKNRMPHKHEKLKYRLVSFIENNLLQNRTLGGNNNYKLINPKHL